MKAGDGKESGCCIDGWKEEEWEEEKEEEEEKKHEGELCSALCRGSPAVVNIISVACRPPQLVAPFVCRSLL